MFAGKTKRGISIKSTIGMRGPTHRETWFLVADRSRLRLFERANDDLGVRLELREEIENPDGRKKGRELVSDRPGRSFDSHTQSHKGQTAAPRHAYGGSFTPADGVTEDLVKQAVELCTQSTLSKTGTRLLVLAEPSLLGMLRPAMERALPKAELDFHDKDFAWLTNSEVEDRLSAF